MRFDGTADTDLHVRQALGAPSIDCLLQKRRLLYLRRLIVHGPEVLKGLLVIGAPSCQVPRTRLVVKDLKSVASILGKTDSLQPEIDQERWMHYLYNVGDEWNDVVRQVNFSESVLDINTGQHERGPDILIYSCTECVHRLAVPRIRL